jgi:peptidoglycan/LPS O-acetylase OafA/YrhL
VAVKRRFHTLEGLRGLAALAVALSHLGTFWGRIACHGYLAVDLFFLISGVVIGHAYEARLEAGWRASQFMAARLRRLAPLYILGVVVGVTCALILVLNGVGQSGLGTKAVLAMGFVPILIGHGPIYPLNVPCWSLFDELTANVVFGFVSPRLTRRQLEITVGAALILLCSAVAVLGSFAVIGGANGIDWLGGLARVAFGFPAGLLIQRWHAAGRLPKLPVPAWAIAGLVAVSFFLPIETPLYDLALVFLVYPCSIIFALGNEPRGKAAVQLFDLAGEISYPLYVLHWPLALLARSATDDAVGFDVGIGFAAATVLLAYAAARYFDLPVREWLRHGLRPAASVPILNGPPVLKRGKASNDPC